MLDCTHTLLCIHDECCIGFDLSMYACIVATGPIHTLYH